MEKNTEMYLRDAAGALATIRLQERRIQALVNRARETGATWTEVGRYLDMSKQTAFARYGKTRPEAPAADPETSKITDADRAGTSETPSIFSDPPGPVFSVGDVVIPQSYIPGKFPRVPYGDNEPRLITHVQENTPSPGITTYRLVDPKRPDDSSRTSWPKSDFCDFTLPQEGTK